MSARTSVPRARGPAYAREEQKRGSWVAITGALEQAVGPGKPAGAWTRFCCPAHEADGGRHHPSLGVKYDGAAGRTVVRCFAGCEDEQVLHSLGLRVRDLFDHHPDRSDGGRGRGARAQQRQRRVGRADRAIDAAGLPLSRPKRALGEQVSPWKTTAVYPYLRADGTVAGEVIRHEAQFTGGRDKKFHQRAWSPQTGWADTGFEKIPFELPRVLEAVESGQAIYVCEGEKDVLAAEAAGLIATTNAGGALAWTSEHAKWLRGAAVVVVVADKDAPGYRRADRVRASLAGLVERVRVVAPATGKDLHDHLQAGHEIGDLVPIPHLDPFTPTSGPESPDPTPEPEVPAAETGPVSAVSSAPQEGPVMSAHSDEVDHIGHQWATFMRLLMGHLIDMARRQAEANRRRAEQLAAEQDADRAAAQAQLAADRAAAEARLRKLRGAGFETCTRAEIAAAVADAATWAEHSPDAQVALAELRTHVQRHYGIKLDGIGSIADTDSPELMAALAEVAAERAATERVSKAQDHMVALVARENLDESVKQQLYAEIERWRTDPTAARLGELSKALADKGVGEQVRTRIRFVAVYLGTPGQQLADTELGTVSPVVATSELRKLGAPLVDPGEEAKPTVDKLFEAYQDRLRRGASTASVRERLTDAMAVLTPEDQDRARGRGNAIRANPAAKFARLWPDHVDRDELATTVRMYVTLASQTEAAAVRANNIDDGTAVAMAKQAAKHRAWIARAISDGKGLHPFERDQLTAVLADVEAGVTAAPEMLFVDDRSAAALDTDRAVRLAHEASAAHRHQVEKLLDTNAAPPAIVRRTREDLTRVMDTHSALAAGQASLGDYERTGAAETFQNRLAAAGVGQPLRNRIAAQLDLAAGEAASMGKQATRISDQWSDRRDVVVATRAPQKPAYDSPQRRAEFAADLKAAGLDDDQIAARMAADAGRAHPAAAAVKRAPGQARTQPRSTAPGAGVHRLNHRGKGRGEPGLGR